MSYILLASGDETTWLDTTKPDFAKSTWSQKFVKKTAFSHVMHFRAVAWLSYEREVMDHFYWAWQVTLAWEVADALNVLQVKYKAQVPCLEQNNA